MKSATLLLSRLAVALSCGCARTRPCVADRALLRLLSCDLHWQEAEQTLSKTLCNNFYWLSKWLSLGPVKLKQRMKWMNINKRPNVFNQLFCVSLQRETYFECNQLFGTTFLKNTPTVLLKNLETVKLKTASCTRNLFLCSGCNVDSKQALLSVSWSQSAHSKNGVNGVPLHKE